MVENKMLREEEELPVQGAGADAASATDADSMNDESMKLHTKGKEDKQPDGMGEKLMEMNDKYLRLSAEFDNYRKRTLKERMELTRTAGEQLLVGILPVVDNFERALESMDYSSDIKSIKEGISLIYSDFKDYLERNGVKEIETKEADFNTDLHEAVTAIPAPAPEMKGKVIDTVEKGYILNDKVIRYAKVVVGE